MYEGVGNIFTQCGDSGGPLYKSDTHEVLGVVTGITNPSTPNDCNSPSTNSVVLYTRVDPGSAISNWVKDNSPKATSDIALQSGTSVPPTDECNGITYEGVCDGEVLSYCNADLLEKIDCAAYGGTCGPDGDNGNDCLYDEPASDCGSVTYVGECDGALLSWCAGTLQQVDCSEYGMTCGYNEQQAYYDCL
jgi:hypothetical protein